MEEKLIKHYSEIGIDLSSTNHPFAREYHDVKKINKDIATAAFEHFLLVFITDLMIIKKYRPMDYDYYRKRIKANHISFWGERFEISWYAFLLHKFSGVIADLKRGTESVEADFVFNYNGNPVALETTTVKFQNTPRLTDPIEKILNKIQEKEEKPYANSNCILVIDITNLSFYRKVFQNFSVSITELLLRLESKFGLVLLQENVHAGSVDNPRYIAKAWEKVSERAGDGVKDFFYNNFQKNKNPSMGDVFFKR